MHRLLIATGMAVAAATGEAAPSADPTVVVDYLQTVAAIRLTPDEAARIIAAEQRLAATDCTGRQKMWGSAATFLRRYYGARPEEQALLRHRARAALQLAPQPDPTALRIIETHDPVVLTDAARKDAVTAADLKAIAASNAFVGSLAGVAPPGGDLSPANLAQARAAYASGAVGRMVLVEAQERDALRVRFWTAMSPAQRGQLTQRIRARVNRPPDVATAAREVEGACANAYLAQMRKDAAARRAVAARGFPDMFGRYVAMRRATVGLDAMMSAWPALHF